MKFSTRLLLMGWVLSLLAYSHGLLAALVVSPRVSSWATTVSWMLVLPAVSCTVVGLIYKSDEK